MGSGDTRRLQVRLTMTPTVLHHMIILSLLHPIDAERHASGAAESGSEADAVRRRLQANYR
jgi:hypothetical protein